MRIRTLVSSAAIVTLLLSSSSLVTQAFAQKGIVGTPSSDWAITKVDDTAGAYCALARKYSTNAVMTFAQNSAEEASFALDFQRPILQVGDTMSVVLDPGAGQERSFDIQPVSNKAFVVRLGRDQAFFNALEKTGFLRVVASGQDYHFSLADMQAGQERIQECVASITAPAAGGDDQGRKEAAAVIAADSERSRVEEALAETKRKNKDLQKQVEKLQSSMRNDQELSELTQKMEALKSENEQLGRRLKEAVASVSSANIYQEQIAELNAQNNILKTDLAQKSEDSSLIEQLRQKIAKGETENRLLQETANAARAELEKEAQQKITELQNSLNAERAENEKKSAALEQIGKTTADLAALEDVNTSLQQKVESLQLAQADSAALKERIAALESENKEHLDALALVQSEAPVIEETMAALRKENEDLQKAKAEIQSTEGERVATLEEKVGSLKKILRDLIPVAEMYKAASIEKDEKIAALDQQFAEHQAQAQAAAEALEQKFAAYQEQAEMSAEKLAQTEAAEATLAAHKARSAELQVALEDIIAVADRYKSASEEKDLAIAALEKNNAEQISQLSALEEHKIAADEQLTLAQEQIAALEKQKVAADEQLTLSQKQITTLEEQIAAAMLESQEGQEKIARLESDLIAMSEESGKIKAELEAALMAVPEPEVAEAAAATLDPVSSVSEIEQSEENAQQSDVAQDSASQEPVLEAAAVHSEAAPQEETIEEALRSALEKAETQQAGAEEVIESVSQETAIKEAVTEEAVVEVAVAEKKMAPLPQRKAAPPQEFVQQSKQAALQSEAVQEENLPVVAHLEDRPARKLTPVTLRPPTQVPASQQARAAVVPSAELEKVLEAEIENNDDSAATSLNEIVPAAGQQAQIQQPEPQPMPIADMNEAQKLEMDVARKLGRQQEVQPVQAAQKPAMIEKEPLAQAALSARQSEDPFAAIPKSEVPVANATKPQPAVEPAPAVARRQPSGDLAEMLGKANIVAPGDVQNVKALSGDVQAAYQWRKGSVYGTAEQRPMASEADFDGMVQKYIERTQSRCPGEFAVVPTDTKGDGASRADSYEVACVGSKVSSGASLVFFNKNGVFTVVAHESPADSLGQAIDSRDQILKVLNTGT